MNRLIGLIKPLRDYAIAKMRLYSDKAASVALTEGETLRWSGRPGFVATFNFKEVVTALVIIPIVTFMSIIVFGASIDFPIDLIAFVTVLVYMIAALFLGWVRQIYRYTKTLGMVYAITDSRLVIIKYKRIIGEIDVEAVESTAVYTKGRLFGNGTVVFNKGDDYFKKNKIIESPPNIKKGFFVFFNIMDPDNVLTIIDKDSKIGRD